MTLNELRLGHQPTADIYSLPVNIIRDALNGKFAAWLGQQGALERRAVRSSKRSCRKSRPRVRRGITGR